MCPYPHPRIPVSMFHETEAFHRQSNNLVLTSPWPRDAMRWHNCGWTLIPVMVRCLMASRHYMDHHWLIFNDFNEAQWDLSEGYFIVTVLEVTHNKVSEIIVFDNTAISPRCQCVNQIKIGGTNQQWLQFSHPVDLGASFMSVSQKHPETSLLCGLNFWYPKCEKIVHTSLIVMHKRFNSVQVISG